MIKIMKLGDVSYDEIFARGTADTDVSDIVADIIYDVRKNGDAALLKYCEKFDGAKLSSLEVSQEEIDEAFKTVEPRFIEVLEKAAEISVVFIKDRFAIVLL